MPKKPLRAALIGSGYIGAAHVEALRRIGNVEIAALCEATEALARQKAAVLGIPGVYCDHRKMLEDETIDVVHNCTPNHLHHRISMDILHAGKHIVSEKPLAVSSTESAELLRTAKKQGVVHAINFNYRYYPLVQQAAEMIRNKELGNVFAIQGCYMQDWLFYETDWNWRLEPKFAGPSRAIADIGSHWFDLAQFITGLKIKRVFADLQTVHKFRRKPKREVQTFAGKNLQRSESARTRISTEDYGHVLVEFSNGARGMVCISQVSAGRKNHIVFEVNGTEKALWWDHERPNELMIGHRSQSNQLLLKDPSLLGPTARDYAHFPGGHNEGYPSALMNFCRNVYRYISKGGKKIDFATFEDGYNSMLVVESVIKSAKTEKWCTVGAK